MSKNKRSIKYECLIITLAESIQDDSIARCLGSSYHLLSKKYLILQSYLL